MASLIYRDEGQLSGEVLVYKYPGLHTGDIHILQATYVPDLEEIVGNSKYAIFFPTVGPRSLADEMANSDFDGDMYWVSRNPEVCLHTVLVHFWFNFSVTNLLLLTSLVLLYIFLSFSLTFHHVKLLSELSNFISSHAILKI